MIQDVAEKLSSVQIKNPQRTQEYRFSPMYTMGKTVFFNFRQPVKEEENSEFKPSA